MVFDAHPPAIIRPAPLRIARVGLSYAVSRVQYEQLRLPAWDPEATYEDMLAYVPRELRRMPRWAILQGIIGLMAVPMFSALVKTTTFLTTTSATDQTWTVIADWNSSDNKVEIVSPGANGGGDGGDGGGGGGYAKKSNITLTPAASVTYRLRAGNAGSGTTNACWFNGASLGVSSVGIQGAGGSTGAVTTSAIGDVTRAGGNGETSDSSFNGSGGGAAGPNGVGGNGSGSGNLAGSADGGTVAGGAFGSAGVSGTEWDASHGCGSGGAGPAVGVGDPGTAGGLYGGGGSAGSTPGAGRQGLIVITNNASL